MLGGGLLSDVEGDEESSPFEAGTFVWGVS